MKIPEYTVQHKTVTNQFHLNGSVFGVIMYSQHGLGILLNSWCFCMLSADPHTDSGCTPWKRQVRHIFNFILFYTVDAVSKKWIQEACYLSISTFSPRFHLAFVTGGVWEERCLACADGDHLAIVWVVITAFTEELSTKNISAKERQCLFLIMFGWYEERRIKIRVGCRATVALYVLLGLTLADRGWTDYLRGVCRSHSRLLWCCSYSILVWPP